MPRPAIPFLLAILCASVTSSAAFAQEQQEPPGAGRCATPDSVAVEGAIRTTEASVRLQAGIAAGTRLSSRSVKTAIDNLYDTGQYESIDLVCVVDPAAGTATMVITVQERPLLGGVDVTGTDAVSGSTVEDQIDLLVGQPIDPARLAVSIQKIDSIYEAAGFYLAEVDVDSAMVEGRVNLTLRIDEGSRLAVSGVRVNGNEEVGDRTVVGSMETRPEGFWWFRKGTFDDEKFRADLAQRLPEMYSSRGFIDFAIVDDSMIVDRGRGKALIDLTVEEGKQYRVGEFEITGNRVFPTSELERFYPFSDDGPTLTQRVTGIITRDDREAGMFDQTRWDAATDQIRNAYATEGYIWASVRPVVERDTLADGTPVVNLRWDIQEGQPAIVNRVEIAGNDYTVEACIRDQLFVVPGDVYNQNRLIQSYQNIANMGFFETPLPPPETKPVNEQGDVDIVFHVKEKRTGNINFGASVGQGTGLGGFIGLDQPNLFGLCKRGSLQWQFGRYINDFNLSYTDPSIRQSRISGTVNAYRSQSRFRVGDLGRSIRTGGNLQIGVLSPWSRLTRFYVQYGLEAQKFGGDGLLGEIPGRCRNCVRSMLGLTATHDTRIDMPFPSQGALQSFSAQFNGGPLGGTADFQRYTGELRAFAPLLQIGGERPGSQPIKLVLGLTARAGAVFGSTGPFFYSQEFALGGTQFGEQLRGYDEFSISPDGFLVGTSATDAELESFGKAFFTSSAEIGLRFNSQIYLSAFYDAGNIWHQPRDINPTRLFRGAGLGASVITPFGPLGLDWAYGFDRVDEFGRPDPKWQFHFRLGQLF